MITWRSEIASVPVSGDPLNRIDSVLTTLDVNREQNGMPTGNLRAGDLCPQCKQAQLDYDGLLNLSCPKCGFAVGGCFT